MLIDQTAWMRRVIESSLDAHFRYVYMDAMIQIAC